MFQELGQVREALPLLQRSLARSQVGDSIVRKLYALIVQQCHRQLGAHDQALAACKTGQQHYPQDCKARHNLAVLYREQGRLAEAEAQWRAALAEQPQFTPALTGLKQLLGGRQAVAS